jgi:hypothetical protein
MIGGTQKNTASRRYRGLPYFHLLLSIITESVIRKGRTIVFFCVVIVSWIARRNEQLGFRVSSWSNRSLQANRRSISPASIEQGLATP